MRCTLTNERQRKKKSSPLTVRKGTFKGMKPLKPYANKQEKARYQIPSIPWWSRKIMLLCKECRLSCLYQHTFTVCKVAWHDTRRVAINQFDVLGLRASVICTWTEPRSLRCVIFWVWICTFGSHRWHPSCIYHSVASGEQVFVGYYLNISNLYAFE